MSLESGSFWNAVIRQLPDERGATFLGLAQAASLRLIPVCRRTKYTTFLCAFCEKNTRYRTDQHPVTVYKL